MTVAEMFRERPEHWGLRGDPYLWDDLEETFKEIQFPYGEECFLEKLYLAIEEITGQRLEEGEDIDVDMHDHGGISSEKVCCAFWSNIAIPLLVERLNVENKRIRDKYQYGRIINLPTEKSKNDFI